MFEFLAKIAACKKPHGKKKLAKKISAYLQKKAETRIITSRSKRLTPGAQMISSGSRRTAPGARILTSRSKIY